ncbi:MAG TPA: response regulator [Anaerolineae bacterium]|nr:response regulator [Anaerolineae bacterium]
MPDVHDLLIADDDRGFVQLVRRMLEASKRDFSISHAYDGAEALAQMRQHDGIGTQLLSEL